MVVLRNNGHMETKASLLGYRVTDSERESERETERKTERVALSVPLWLDSHLVTMCDQSSRPNDELPEASSIRPGLTGLPERERGTKRDAYRHVLHYLCVCVYGSISNL